MKYVRQIAPKLFETIVFSLVILFLPTQLGKHFWPDFAFINGLRVDYLSPTFYFTDGLILLLALFSFPQLASSKLKKSGIGILVTTCYLIATVLFSFNVQNSIYSLVKVVEVAFLSFYIANAGSKSVSLEKISKLLAIGVIGESIIAIGQFINQGSIGGLLYFLGERSFTASTPGIANASLNGELVMRAYGTFSHPNVLAGYLVLCMVLIFFKGFPSKGTLQKPLTALALLLGTIALVLTLSRIAILLWVGLIVAVFFYQLFKKQFMKAKVHTGSALVVLFVIGILFSQLLLPRFLQTALTDESVTQRQVLIDASLTIIGDHPIVGVGLGNFLPTLSSVQSPLSSLPILQPVHNIFLLVFAETGIIGLGLLIMLFGKSLQRLIRSLRMKHDATGKLALVICLIMILIIGLFDHYFVTLQQGQLLLALILGLAWQ